MSEPMTERNPADVLADRLDELRREMELRFSGLFVENAVNRLSAAANFLRQPTQSDALREENERLREHLISALDTLKDAEVCDDKCGPCNEAYAALQDQSK